MVKSARPSNFLTPIFEKFSKSWKISDEILKITTIRETLFSPYVTLVMVSTTPVCGLGVVYGTIILLSEPSWPETGSGLAGNPLGGFAKFWPIRRLGAAASPYEPGGPKAQTQRLCSSTFTAENSIWRLDSELVPWASLESDTSSQT